MDYTKEGISSVKVHNAPGGKSNFSLAWDTEPSQPLRPKNTPVQAPVQPAMKQEPYKPNNDAKTSVKVHNPPGGRSNFTLG